MTVIIIPCFNEAKRLPINSFETFIESKSLEVAFLFVNDGSTDDTIGVLMQLKSKFNDQVEILDLKQNVGKAEAVRQGMLMAKNENHHYLGYFDADLATPLEEIARLVEYTKRNVVPYIVMGSRVKLFGFSEIRRNLSRHYIGRVFATVVSNMLRLPIYDTQCGAKLVHSKVVSTLFKEKFSSKWMFDVELLFRLKNNYTDFECRIIEIPLKKWNDIAGTKIPFSYFLQAPLDLLKIYFKYK